MAQLTKSEGENTETQIQERILAISQQAVFVLRFPTKHLPPNIWLNDHNIPKKVPSYYANATLLTLVKLRLHNMVVPFFIIAWKRFQAII